MEVKCWLNWFRARCRQLAPGYTEIPGAGLEEESFWTKITLVGWVTVVFWVKNSNAKSRASSILYVFPQFFKKCFCWFDLYVVLRYFSSTVRGAVGKGTKWIWGKLDFSTAGRTKKSLQTFLGGKWGDVLTDVQLKTGNCHQKQRCLEEGWTERAAKGKAMWLGVSPVPSRPVVQMRSALPCKSFWKCLWCQHKWKKKSTRTSMIWKRENIKLKVAIRNSNVWALILRWKFNVLQLMEKYLTFYKEKP